MALVVVGAVDTREHQAALERWTRVAVPPDCGVDGLQRGAGGVRIESYRDVVVLLAQPALVLEAETVVERQARAHAPVVLDVPSAVEQRVDTVSAVVIDRAGRRCAEQEA